MSIQEQIKKSLDQHSISSKSIVAYIVFGAIILVFVLFGFPGSRGTMGKGYVADVGGTLISGADLKEETDQLMRFYSQMFGGNMGMQAQQKLLESQALENLITRELLAQEATESGFLVTDKEIADLILEIPAFQDKGVFDKSRYFQYLEATHSTAGEFENKFRKEAQRMRVKRIFDALESEKSLVSTKENEMSSLKLNVQFAKINRESLVRLIAIGDQAISEFLKNPENIKKVEVDYETHKKDLYTQAEQVNAKHILIKVKEGDAESEKEALTRINDLKVRAAKEDFGALAKANSQDEGSKERNGDLGFFGRGQMVPPFEEAAFNAETGSLVGPVKSNFGYHLIKVLEKKKSEVKTLEQVKSEIARKLLAETQLDEKFNKLETALTANKVDDVENQLKEWNVTWEETGDFDLQADSIPKLNGGETLSDAVWSLSKPGQWVNHLVREGTFRYLIKLKELKTVESDKKEDSKMARMGSSGGLFEGWLENIRSDKKVQRNNSGTLVE